jgi:hypothetical protein
MFSAGSTFQVYLSEFLGALRASKSPPLKEKNQSVFLLRLAGDYAGTKLHLHMLNTNLNGDFKSI